MFAVPRTEVHRAPVHVSGRFKISFNDEQESNTTRTIDWLGYGLENDVTLHALTIVRTRRKRSNVVGATSNRIPAAGELKLPWLFARHWSHMGSYTIFSAYKRVSPSAHEYDDV